MTLLALNLPDIPGAPVEVLVFATLALLAVAGAFVVIVASDPFVSALALLLNFGSLGLLYLTLESPFVAVAQVLVYAGAVVVLFLFVIAYLGDRRELLGHARRVRWLAAPAALVGLVLMGALSYTVAATAFQEAAPINADALGTTPDSMFPFGSAHAVGEVFLTKYVLEFEVTSLVLLVAAIGGIALGLTGRSRHDRLRALMHTESADQHKRRFEREARRAARRAEVDRGAKAPVGASEGSSE